MVAEDGDTVQPELTQLRLGEDAGTLQISSMAEGQVAALRLLEQATRTVRIASRLLDPALLNTPQVWDAVRGCISQQPRFRAHILVLEPQALASSGHALLRLVQDYSSFVELRVPAEVYREYNAFMLLVDECGVMHRPLAEGWHGIVDFNDPGRVRKLGHEFDKMWETAAKDINLARMRL